MEDNGQLTFADDPLLPRCNDAYALIERGEFSAALAEFDSLMTDHPEYPGIIEGYRTSKFWDNRHDELVSLGQGKDTADFLMQQWNDFAAYAAEKTFTDTPAFKAAMKHVYFTAAHHYKIAFQTQQNPTDGFALLLNLGVCFITLGEYNLAVETLEYARTSSSVSARTLALLGEAYFHTGDIPKSMLLFREAFFINPAEIDLELIKSKPIQDIITHLEKIKPHADDIREWIPVAGYTEDIFYVKRQLNNQQVESIKRDIYNLEQNLKNMPSDKISKSPILPRIINKYLWMLDYFIFQKYDFQSISEIRSRLSVLDRDIFEPYFANHPNKM